MSDLQKSKRFDLIDKFNDTSRYLDDIFTIDNPDFEKHIPDIYPAELQLNKANTSDKETSFLDLNIKVIGSDIHTSVYDKRDDFGFPIVNFPCYKWSTDSVHKNPPNICWYTMPSYCAYIFSTRKVNASYQIFLYDNYKMRLLQRYILHLCNFLIEYNYYSIENSNKAQVIKNGDRAM